MIEPGFQKQRFEFKYQLSNQTAAAMREYVRMHLVADPYSAVRDNYEYPVYSLYLDSPNLELGKATLRGEKNRYKLRVRFYEYDEQAPVFFEIKKRNAVIISKVRCRATRDVARAVLAGHPPFGDEALSLDDDEIGALHEFSRRMTLIAARPTALVAYWREAWVTAFDNSVRVTFDKRVCIQPDEDFSALPDLNRARPVFGDNIVLELKFTDRFPNWMREMVRVFGLQRGAAGKYADGLTRLFPTHVTSRENIRVLYDNPFQPFDGESAQGDVSRLRGQKELGML